MGVGWARGGLIGIALAVGACHEATVQTVEATAIYGASAVDFGDVPVGEHREAVVLLKNAGYVPFSALEALALQGSSSYEVELEDAGRVMPGETRNVRIRFHPLTEGTLEEQVAVTTDAEHEPRKPLDIRGQGTPTQFQLSAQALDFQTLEIDSDRTLGVQVENPVDLPIALTLTGGNAAQFESNVQVIPPLGKVTVDARYFPQVVGGSRARLELRSCEGCTATVIDLTGKAVRTAFAFDPEPVPFDEIPVHESTRSRTQVTNITWRAVEIGKLSTSDRAFTPLTDLAARTVAPGETVALDVQFAARYSGPSMGTLEVDYTSNKPRNADVLLDARGGRPTLAVAPVAIDFGELPVGGKLERTLRLSNAGTNGALHLKGVRGTAAQDQYNVSTPRRGATQYAYTAGSAWPDYVAPDVPIAPGDDAIEIKVYFEPTAEGQHDGQIVLLSDDLFSPERVITVTGKARTIAPCTWRVLPQPAIDFGNVPAGSGAVLGFRFENTGDTECAVKDIHLGNDADGAFFMPGGPLTGGVVIKDDGFAAQVAFRARTAGNYQGELVMTVNGNTQVKLPLRAVAQPSCLVASPNFLDFGPIRYDCPSAPRRTFVTNQCRDPIAVDAVWMGAGTSDQFSVLHSPAFPHTLAAGQGFELEVGFARSTLGQHFTPLYLSPRGEAAPFLIPLLGEVNHDDLEVDRFVQGRDGELDVLFVVGNTTTMQPYQERLKAEVGDWLDRARAAGVDLHVGVTTTGLVTRSPLCPGGAEGGEAGRLFPVDGSSPRVISTASGTAAADLQRALGVGLCHNLVQGLETMRSALSSPLVNHPDDPRTPVPNDGNGEFLRASARLAVVFVADEDDHSGFDPVSYTQFLQALKGPNLGHRVAAFALVPTDASCKTAGAPGPRFAEVAKATGGEVRSVCSPSYAPILDPMTQRAATAQRHFRLTRSPTGAGDIHVKVGGVDAPAGSWTWDPTANQVVFAEGSVPPAGVMIEVRYRSVCATTP